MQFGSGCAALVFTSVEPAMFARMRTDVNQKDKYINMYIYRFIYIHVCVSVTRGTPTHTANAHHVGDVMSFFSL